MELDSHGIGSYTLWLYPPLRHNAWVGWLVDHRRLTSINHQVLARTHQIHGTICGEVANVITNQAILVGVFNPYEKLSGNQPTNPPQIQLGKSKTFRTPSQNTKQQVQVGYHSQSPTINQVTENINSKPFL